MDFLLLLRFLLLYSLRVLWGDTHLFNIELFWFDDFDINDSSFLKVRLELLLSFY